MIDAPFHTNQTEIIRSIAKSLPIGYSLYVKENPSQISREWRDIDNYKLLMDIPNTTLIHPSFPSEKLLENCSLVINIAGTSAFESAFFEKPALVFIDRGYTILPSINIVNDICEKTTEGDILCFIHSKTEAEDISFKIKSNIDLD